MYQALSGKPQADGDEGGANRLDCAHGCCSRPPCPHPEALPRSRSRRSIPPPGGHTSRRRVDTLQRRREGRKRREKHCREPPCAQMQHASFVAVTQPRMLQAALPPGQSALRGLSFCGEWGRRSSLRCEGVEGRRPPPPTAVRLSVPVLPQVSLMALISSSTSDFIMM